MAITARHVKHRDEYVFQLRLPVDRQLRKGWMRYPGAEMPAFSLRTSRRISDPEPLDAEQGGLVAKRPKLNKVAHQSSTGSSSIELYQRELNGYRLTSGPFKDQS